MTQDKRDLGENTLSGAVGGWAEEIAEDTPGPDPKKNEPSKGGTPSSTDPGN